MRYSMEPNRCRSGFFPGAVVWALIVCLFLPGYAFSQAQFYKGKTLTIIQARRAGGAGDMRVRAVIPYLRRYIPGNPTIVSEFMPGGGGRKAANHIYRAARPDGLTIGNVGGGLVANAVLREPGVQYDLDNLIYLGTPNSANQYVFVTKRDLGLSSLEKLRAFTGLRIGAQSVGHDIYNTGRLFAWLLDFKNPRFVTGYSGTEVDLALERGEVDARTRLADGLLQRSPEWLEKGLVDLHAIIEIPKGEKHPRFAHLPELESFAKSDRERKVLAMYRTFRLVGSPYILPPGTPTERVEMLQEAMRKSFKDPEFHRQFKKLTGGDPTPLMPEEMERAIRELPRDPQLVELLKKIAGGEPLPLR